MRKTKLQNHEYYHIYNRGADKRRIFLDKYDYIRFLTCLREFNTTGHIGSLYMIKKLRAKQQSENQSLRDSKSLLETKNNSPEPLVEILCYNLLPNHYHFILKQLSTNGISQFMYKLNMGYTKYFNSKYDRSGCLFQGTYKAIHVKTNEYLLYLSGYINGNAAVHKITQTEKWPWCSFPDYTGLRNGTLCYRNNILKQFQNVNDYQKYVKMVIEDAVKTKIALKSYFFE